MKEPLEASLTRPRLLGVSVTGPIYQGPLDIAFIPLNSALSLLKELAQRAQNPTAPVVSSLAARVSGDDAYKAWAPLSAQVSGQIGMMQPRARIRALRQIIDYLGRDRVADGIEPVLMTTFNGTWPWLTRVASDASLALVATAVSESRFAQTHLIPVLDPNRRTFSVFGRAELSRLDLEHWKVNRTIMGEDRIAQLPAGAEGLGRVGQSQLEAILEEQFGSESDQDSGEDLLPSRGSPGVPGDMPSREDLPGGQSSRGRPGHRSVDDIARDWNPLVTETGTPGGLRDIRDLPGQGGRPQDSGLGGRRGQPSLNDLNLGGSRGAAGFINKHGPEGFRLGGFRDATPGGPFAPAGKLPATGGGELDEDTMGVVALVAGVFGLYGGVAATAAGVFTADPPLAAGGGFLVGVSAANIVVGVGILTRCLAGRHR